MTHETFQVLPDIGAFRGRGGYVSRADRPELLGARVKPFVGFVSAGNTVAVVHASGRLICRSTYTTTVLLAAGFLLFGPGLTYAVARAWPAVREGRSPAVLWGAVGAMSLAAWWGFLRALGNRKRAEIVYATGEVVLRGWFGARRQICRDQIQNVEVTAAWFRNEAGATRNHVLWLLLNDGERLALCASPDASVIERLEKELRALAGKTTTQALPTKGSD